MKLIEITDKEKYNEIVKKQKHSQFLQSWEWGEFQMEMNDIVKRFGVMEDEEIIQVFTLIKKTLPFGKSYYYCPRVEISEIITKNIEKIAKKEGVMFLRFDPVNDIGILKPKKTIDVQPSKTLMLHLEKSEEELLNEMHQKTRYNIRLAKKKGVEILPVGSADIETEFENFWKIMGVTLERDGFRAHGKEYYKKMLEIGYIKLYLAKFENKYLAASIVSFFGDTSTYIHGASSNEHRNLMAPFLLQWEVILAAKSRGCEYYDFYGIDKAKWPGVTRFKKGFGGVEVTYPGTFDLIFNGLWYNLYMLTRKLRRLRS